jgi:sucrose-6F-phosphate phosphohydrolase
MPAFCLVTDIDGTLIGEETSTRELRGLLLEERRALEAVGARQRWVIATGRSIKSAREVLLETGFELADFDAFVTSVGAELYLPGEATPCSTYQARLGAGGFRRDAVLEALAACDFLSLQTDEEQAPYKVSYLMPDEPAHRERLYAALGGLPFACETIISHDQYLDIGPRPGGKGAAVAHLIERWGLSAPRTIAAGDSRNDTNMLDRHWPAIVVGNGWKELDFLRARPNVYFAAEKHAAGVLEGLRAFGFLPNAASRR